MVTDIRVIVPTALASSAGPNVIWETNFASDENYSQTSQNLPYTADVPTGFTFIKATTDCSITAQNTGGVGGSVAMRLTYDPAFTQPTINLAKHLTGNKTTGYDELYIRYQFKFPDAFRFGSPLSSPVNTVPYWKWGRLWQNTGTTNDGTWTENRVDSKYAVWNWGNGNPALYGIENAWTFGANSGSNLNLGSAGGERFRSRPFASGQYPNSSYTYMDSFDGLETDIGTGDGEFTNNPQVWHTVEWHISLSDGVTHGILETWLDGVLMNGLRDHDEQGGGSYATEGKGTPDAAGDYYVNPTEVDVSGYNMMIFFDNMVDWNDDWDEAGVDGYIDLNDLCIATSRIGHDYVVTGDGS